MSNMAGKEIQSSVSSINAAFLSVRDLLVKTGNTSPQNRPKAKHVRVAEEGRLKKSLNSAPKAIEGEYTRGIAAHGKRFQHGDVEARAALTTILLRINSGLVNIIASFLTDDKKARKKCSIDYTALAVLADSCKIDACCCLGELYTRLSGRGKGQCSPRAMRLGGKERAPRRPGLKATSNGARPRNTRVPRQMQWVMIRSRPRESRRHSSSTSLSEASKTIVGTNSSAAADTGKPRASGDGLPIPRTTQRDPKLPHHQVSSQAHHKAFGPAGLRKRRPEPGVLPSTGSLDIQTFNDNENLRVQKLQTSISRQPTRKTINSIYSFASESTKLGEIPLRRYTHNGDIEEGAEAVNGYRGPEGPTATTNEKMNRTTLKLNFISRFLRRSTGTGHV